MSFVQPCQATGARRIEERANFGADGYLLGSYRIATAPRRTPTGSGASSRHASTAWSP